MLDLPFCVSGNEETKIFHNQGSQTFKVIIHNPNDFSIVVRIRNNQGQQVNGEESIDNFGTVGWTVENGQEVFMVIASKDRRNGTRYGNGTYSIR